LGVGKFKLTKGISLSKNKYNNILVDLLYLNIPSELINLYPFSIVFGIKWVGKEIKDLSFQNIKNFRANSEADYYGLGGEETYWYDEYQIYKSDHSDYSGNSFTYLTFCQLIKLLYNGVPMYHYRGVNLHMLKY